MASTLPRGTVTSVNMAPVEHFEVRGHSLHSGIRKRPQSTAVEVRQAGIPGDEVGDTKHHGGPNRALHAFAAEHYDYFGPMVEERQLQPTAPPWAGENLTLRGYHDAIAHVGDVVRVGSTLLQTSMPTERCGNPGLVSGIPKLRSWMIKSLRTGFYFRVLEAGRIAAGDEVTVLERPHADWPIARLSALMYEHPADGDLLAAAETLDALAPEWKQAARRYHDLARRQT